MIAKLCVSLLITATFAYAPNGYEGEDDWSIEYEVYQEGPRTVYSGTARLLFDENTNACLSYCFEIPEGRLSGSSISSDPGQPMLAFDEWQRNGNEIMISWCRERSDLQSNPVQTPRNFSFHIIKTEFNADDLGKLLSEWGPPRLIDAPWPERDYTLVSAWDLNADTMVDGQDLAILLAGWKIE